MLEALLNHFRSYGMEDLEFIIVNSKLSHSQDKLHELKKRVSFEVYQETDEAEVWNVMQGGKDDMYVYDRCGRLTYYIPFPLSILNESPLVSNAILATYFRSPCGDNCDKNQTLDIDEFVDFETENATQEENSTYTETPIYVNGTTNETQISNDLFDLYAPEDDISILNSNTTDNGTDYDYPTYDNNLSMNETNSTNVVKAKSFFSSIYKLFFNGGNNDEKIGTENSNSTVLNATSSYGSDLPMTAQNATNNNVTNIQVHPAKHDHHSHEHVHPEHIDAQAKKKSDRCLEADYEVCKSWSKKRLLHAQKCCYELQSDLESQDSRSCNHFGKKRCKKMQSILKCCIKTVYTEPMETTEESTILIPTEESTMLTTEEIPVAVGVAELVCCKTIDVGKMCRVSYSEKCEEGEYMEDRPKEHM